MQSNLFRRVDAIVKSGVMEAASDVADLLSMNDEVMDANLIGYRKDDGCLIIESVSRKDEHSVGKCMSSMDGGVEPTEEMISMMDAYPDGILMVIDPYACEIRFYRNTEDGLADARILVSE